MAFLVGRSTYPLVHMVVRDPLLLLWTPDGHQRDIKHRSLALPRRQPPLRMERELKETRELARTTLANGICGHLMGLTGNYQTVLVDLDGSILGMV